MQPHSLAPGKSPASKITGIPLPHQAADVLLASYPFLVHFLTIAGSWFCSARIVFWNRCASICGYGFLVVVWITSE